MSAPDPKALSPQALAEACARVMWESDRASRALGMEIERIAPGEATLAMTITAAMTNGHGIGHGGYTFTLADSAFAFACNTYDQRTVAQSNAITYLAPVREGDRLTATAREISRQGRGGIYDVRVVNQNGVTVAEFRGLSRTVKGAILPETEGGSAGA